MSVVNGGQTPVRSGNHTATDNPPDVDRLKIAALLGIVGLFIYVGLASTNFDGNDIIELQAIKDGRLEALLNPNHLLFRPLVRVLHDLLALFFRVDTPISVAQFVVGLSAALGLALFYLWIARLVPARRVGIITTIAFGTSWAYWVYSISALYFIPAVSSVLGTLVALQILWKRGDNQVAWGPLMMASFTTALALLFWQANIFFIPSILIGLYLRYRSRFHVLWISVVCYLFTAGALVLGAYLAASLALFSDNWTVTAFVNWIANYGSASLATWGVLDISRIQQVPLTLASTILPVWEGFGLRALMSGDLQSARWLPLLAIPAFVLIILLPLPGLFSRRRFNRQQRGLFFLLLLGASFYLPFIVWWDPTEPIWYIIPSIGLWSIVGLLWDAHNSRWMTTLYTALVLMITVANFSEAIWQRHAAPNPLLALSACLHDHMQPDDLLVTFEYQVGDYLRFFYGHDSLSMIDTAARLDSPDESMQRLAETFRIVEERGGSVYYKSVDLLNNHAWLNVELGYLPDHLERLEGPVQFTCNGESYRKLENILAVS